ncbi:MAG: hypothetical protein QOJ29_5384 [Thermoleophilaceae bacterium]|jgi:pimeloyl-ACP methyl ester carboxylesterase|nr:hypothetical protein [Thermoleophilaceae bacterium]
MPAAFAQLGEYKQVQLPEGPLGYHDAGSGPVLLFVHGVFANAALWSNVVPLLSDRYRCIVPDFPLGSHTIPMGSQLSPFVVADMIGELIDELGLKDATLVGNDTGGALCQMLVVRRPGVVKRMVLTNCDAYDKFPPQPFTYLTLVPRIPGAISVLANSMRLHVNRRLPIAYGWLSKTMSREVEDSFVNPVIRDKGVRADIAGFLRRAKAKDLMATASSTERSKSRCGSCGPRAIARSRSTSPSGWNATCRTQRWCGCPEGTPSCRSTSPSGWLKRSRPRWPAGTRQPRRRSPTSWRSFSRSWRAITRRTVPERERVTSDSVVAPRGPS